MIAALSLPSRGPAVGARAVRDRVGATTAPGRGGPIPGPVAATSGSGCATSLRYPCTACDLPGRARVAGSAPTRPSPESRAVGVCAALPAATRYREGGRS